METIIPIVLCGGSGTRIWPLSRELYPKQFLSLVNDKSMFQETVIRLSNKSMPELLEPAIICNEEHRFLVTEQLREINANHNGILLEPVAKNTAPAAAIAAIHAIELFGDGVSILILPSDHFISDVDAFGTNVSTAKSLLNEFNTMIIFGVKPDLPHTGYGYIKMGKKIPHFNAFNVKEFKEKPDQKKAHRYLNEGGYLWNSGMFLFQAKTYLELLTEFSPNIMKACELSYEHASSDHDFLRLDSEKFTQSPVDSIDYAVMENAIKTDVKITVVPINIGWNDIGSWRSLWSILQKDKNSNVNLGDIFSEKTSNCFLYSDKGILATIGLDEIIVVRTSDAVLVANKNNSEEVSGIVKKLDNLGISQSKTHRKVTRPWGTFDSIDESEGFKVKRLVVNPGAKLSLQLHHHRAEHWVVVKGVATVTKGEKIITLKANESIYIPLGVKHSIENLENVPLEIIEVQTGEYLEEDDIVRFDDIYGRAK